MNVLPRHLELLVCEQTRERETVRWWEYWRSPLGFSKWRHGRWLTLLYSPYLILAQTHFPGYYNGVSETVWECVCVCVCVCVKWSETLAVRWLRCLKVQQQQITICLNYHCCSHHTQIYMLVVVQTDTCCAHTHTSPAWEHAECAGVYKWQSAFV